MTDAGAFHVRSCGHAADDASPSPQPPPAQGNGFITDTEIIRSRGLSDANPFFKELLKKPYNGSVRGT
jgi:hypothetical protein